MCGIVGFVGFRGKETLHAMATALRHRGPDGEGYFESDSVSLAARRLAIVDVPGGHQPMRNEDGSIVVVFNGEIYNAAALRSGLERLGHRFHTRCDTEIIPHLYEECGEEFVQSLNGQFAIAIWDGNKRKLLLSRDRLGIKPLFYHMNGPRFHFGSEIKAVLAGLEKSPATNLEAVYHYLSFKCVPAPLTVYKGIHAVLPGEQIVLQDRRLTKRCYWTFDYTPIESVGPEEAVDRLEQLLTASVKRRMIADVPVGALLSGGVDSSLIVALAAKESNKPIHTFTLGYKDRFQHKDREVEAARQVARQFNTDHHEYEMSSAELVEDLPRIFGCFDEPFAGVMSPYFLNKLVGRHVKVCLGGDGADELFGSYLSHRLAQPIHNLLQFGTGEVRANPRLAAPFERDIDYVESLADAHDWLWRSSLFVFSEEDKRKLLNTDFHEFSMYDTTVMARNIFAQCATEDPQNRQQHFDCCTVLPDLVLNFNDRLSMAHSIETRVPFLDHEIVEFATPLPGNWKIRNGCCKWILKEVAKRHLPAEIVDRPKEGFVMPVNDWQRNELRNLIEETLRPGRLAAHGFFRPEAVSDMVARYYGGETRLQYKVWSLFCFQSWYDSVGSSKEVAATEEARDGLEIDHARSKTVQAV